MSFVERAILKKKIEKIEDFFYNFYKEQMKNIAENVIILEKKTLYFYYLN